MVSDGVVSAGVAAQQAGPEFPSTWARLTPDKAAVIVLDAAGHAVRTLSYGELEDRSVRCA
ncbi:MAG TPA: hypothetical protein VH008_14300, partial [Pseudonocardia sp.]|nr:hypothetical protein [Pseudonocardia sp.]